MIGRAYVSPLQTLILKGYSYLISKASKSLVQLGPSKCINKKLSCKKAKSLNPLF